MPVESDEALREILGLETVAVVGCSSSPGKAAHNVPRYLRKQDYEVVPVNPYADEIFGRESYDSVGAVDETIDIGCIFRPSDEVSEVVDGILERDDAPIIWTQSGIVDREAAARAEAEGRTVVQDRCMKVEHRRLHGSSR